MNISERQLHVQLQLWSVLGPIMLLVVLGVGLLKSVNNSIYLPSISIIGLLLCLKWKKQGAIAASIIACLSLIAFYGTFYSDERLWFVGMTAAACLAFIVTALAQDETETISDQLQQEAERRKSNAAELELVITRVNEERQVERVLLEKRITDTTTELQTSQSQLQSKEKLLQILREEAEHLQDRQTKLLEESLQFRQLSAKLEGELHHSEVQVKNLNESVHLHRQELQASKQQIFQLEMGISKLELQVREQAMLISTTQDEARLCHQQIESFAIDLGQAEAAQALLESQMNTMQARHSIESQTLKDTIENLSREKTLLGHTLERIQKEVEMLHHQEIEKNGLISEQCSQLIKLNQNFEKKEAEFAEINEALKHNSLNLKPQAEEAGKLRVECQSLQKILEETTVEKEKIKKDKHLSESLLKQLREQFDEKSSILSQTRNELFHTKERLQAVLREKEEKEKFGRDSYALELEKHLLTSVEDRDDLAKEVRTLEELVTAITCS